MHNTSKIQKRLNQLKDREFFVVRQGIVPVTMDNSRSFFWRIGIMSKRLELRGRKFGRLTVVCETGRTKQEGLLWECLCSCGKKKIVSGNSLMSGQQSCGCLQKEMCIKASTTHGLRYTPEYRIWTLMKNRCLNKNANNYKDYGGRGITVCESWLKFEIFYKDMGQRPSRFFTIERTNNDAGYSPENCIWATKEVQARNTRLHKNNTSGTQGVGWHKRIKKYQARIVVNRRELHLGYFQNIEDAVAARKAGELEYWKKGEQIEELLRAE